MICCLRTEGLDQTEGSLTHGAFGAQSMFLQPGFGGLNFAHQRIVLTGEDQEGRRKHFVWRNLKGPLV